MITQRDIYSTEDLRMYFSGCIVGVYEEGIIRPYLLHEVDEGRVAHLHRQGSQRTIEFADKDLLLDWPTLGVVQRGMYVSYVMTDSWDRQYKKGLRQQRLIVDTNMMREALAIGVYRGELSIEDFHDMYSPLDYDLTQALIKLEDLLAVRINRDFFLTWKNGYEYPMLGYRNLLIGQVRDGQVQLLETAAPLRSDVLKFATNVKILGV
jgi:hypothetical protein